MAFEDTILTSDLFMQIILPFLLVFTLVFAILQKTKIFGEGKARIDAITALVIGLIVTAFSKATNIITTLMPFLAVAAVIILVFMILYGFVAANEKGADFSWAKIPFGIIIGLAVIVAVLIATDYWNTAISLIKQGSVVTNVIFIAVIIAAIFIVIGKGKGKSSSS